MIMWMLMGYSIVFGGLAAATVKKELKKYYVLAKCAASAAFMVIFLMACHVSLDVRQFWLMLPAFLFCFVGDVLLAFYNKSRKRKFFLSGLLVFLAGHICFVRWLGRGQRLMTVDFLFPLIAVSLTFGLTSLKQIHTGRLRPFIMIYAFFVSLFFARGVHLAVLRLDVPSLAVAVGSALFLISDISILFLYFYEKTGWRIHIFNLATYYYGMFFLAISPLLQSIC